MIGGLVPRVLGAENSVDVRTMGIFSRGAYVVGASYVESVDTLTCGPLVLGAKVEGLGVVPRVLGRTVIGASVLARTKGSLVRGAIVVFSYCGV